MAETATELPRDDRSGEGGDGGRRAGGEESTVRRTHRWRGIVAVVLFALAVGVLAKRPSVLLVAAVGVAFAAYPRLTGTPDPALSIEREIDPESPEHGDAVAVTTTLRNEGDETLFDLRVIDGVPPMLSVLDGSPRRATALRPGEETTVEYSLRAVRGVHRFRPATVLVRDASGATEVETTVAEETTVECAARIPDVPLRARSRHRTGQLVTDEGGSGIEFHRTRRYERGDPVSRIDWRRLARTGELTSIDFREERLADVVLCVDARAAAYRAGAPDEPHAVAHGVAAAGTIAETLFDSDHRVGLATIGRELTWLPPGAGQDHEERFRRRLASDPAGSVVPPNEPLDGVLDPDGEGDARSLDRQLAALRTQLDPNAQVLLLTPLCDDAATRIAQVFESAGCAVTVVSVDVTDDATPGGRLARVERENRLHRLRNAGVPVVDWNPDARLGTALAAMGRQQP